MLRHDWFAAGSWVVLVAWLAASGLALGYFEFRDLRPFDAVAAQPFGGTDAALAEQWFRSTFGSVASLEAPPKITFVHLYNPECRCNAFTEPHLQRLMERYQSRGVRFVAALGPRSTGVTHVPFGLPSVRSTGGMLGAAGIRTAPAVLMFDAAGRLIYYGPYSDSAWCGSPGALVDRALDRALSGSSVMTEIPASRGCFCEWT
jgi:hypothetical protein